MWNTCLKYKDTKFPQQKKTKTTSKYPFDHFEVISQLTHGQNFDFPGSELKMLNCKILNIIRIQVVKFDQRLQYDF